MSIQNDLVVEEKAQALTPVLLSALSEWLADKPPQADPYYAARRDRGYIFDKRDLEAARFIYSSPHRADRVLEVGMGAGQLVLLLAALGIRATGVEFARNRFALATHLQAALRSSATMVQGYYPDETPGLDADLVVTTNVVNGFWGVWTARSDVDKVQQFFRGRPALIDASVWWVERDEGRIGEVLDAFRGAGYLTSLVEGTRSIYYMVPA